jgi:hypothetical protein
MLCVAGPGHKSDLFIVCLLAAAGMTEAETVLSLASDLDRILRTDKHFLMADWIAAARKFGNTSDERLWLEWNARAQVTSWGSIESNSNLIADYASKQWGGLVGSYHLPLWQHFFTRMHEFVTTNHSAPSQISGALEQELNMIGAQWTNSTQAVPGLSSEETLSVATELLAKWKAAMPSQFPADVSQEPISGESATALPQWEVVSASAEPVIGPAQTVPHGVHQGFETGQFMKINGTYYVAINELGLCEDVVWDRTTRAALWSAPNASGPWQRITTLRNTSSMHTLCKLDAGEGLLNGCSWAPTLVYAPSVVNGSKPVWNLFYSACEDLNGAPSPDPSHPKDKPGDGIVHAVSTTQSMRGPYIDVPSTIVPGSGVVMPFSHAFTTWQLHNGTYMSFRNNAPTATMLPSGRPDFSVGLERAIANEGKNLGGPWSYDNNTVPFPCGPENPIVSTSSDGQWYYAVYDALEQLPVGHAGQASATGPGAGLGCTKPSSKTKTSAGLSLTLQCHDIVPSSR